MGVSEGRANLAEAAKKLVEKWAETRSSWDDVRAREFEARVLVPLQADVKAAVGAMDNLDVLLNQVRRDCS
ncbi:MAG TPA: hypothetical protein VK324_08085 [Tepidisphaeraceae bacterium]|nr:hypothetical protein [Tepidisphaeraceae bacterium]